MSAAGNMRRSSMACLTPVMQQTREQWRWHTFSSREPTQWRKAMRRGAVPSALATRPQANMRSRSAEVTTLS